MQQMEVRWKTSSAEQTRLALQELPFSDQRAAAETRQAGQDKDVDEQGEV